MCELIHYILCTPGNYAYDQCKLDIIKSLLFVCRIIRYSLCDPGSYKLDPHELDLCSYSSSLVRDIVYNNCSASCIPGGFACDQYGLDLKKTFKIIVLLCKIMHYVLCAPSNKKPNHIYNITLFLKTHICLTYSEVWAASRLAPSYPSIKINTLPKYMPKYSTAYPHEHTNITITTKLNYPSYINIKKLSAQIFVTCNTPTISQFTQLQDCSYLKFIINPHLFDTNLTSPFNNG